MGDLTDALDLMTNNILGCMKDYQTQPREWTSGKGGFSSWGYAFKLMFLEKEIIIFTLLQGIVSVLSFWLWGRLHFMFHAFGSQGTAEIYGPYLGNTLFWLWSFICIGLAALPLGLFVCCVGTVHFLHKAGRKISVATCLKTVYSNLWNIWVFQWFDLWFTATMVVDLAMSLLRRNGPGPGEFREESRFDAWNAATPGIIPNLLEGRDLGDAATRSVPFLKEKMGDLWSMSSLYTASAWAVGMPVFLVGFILMLAHLHQPGIPAHGPFYGLFMAVVLPSVAAIMVVQIFIKPFYMITAFDIYSDYLSSKKEDFRFPEPPSKVADILITLAVFGLIAWGAYFCLDPASWSVASIQ